MIFGHLSKNYQISNYNIIPEYKNLFKSDNLSIYYNEINCITECENNIVIIYGDLYEINENISSVISEKKSNNLNVNEFISELNGEFLIIIYDKKKYIIELYKDHFGFIPLYYSIDNYSIFFSTQLKQIFKTFKSKPKIDNNWFLYNIAGNKINKTNTPFIDIKQIPEASYLKYYIENDKSTYEKYWHLKTEGDNQNNNQVEYLDFFKDNLIKSIKNRMQNEKIVSSELSGGLDSSGVTSIAANQNQNKIFAFSHILEKESIGKIFPYTDESNYSEKTLSNYNNISHIKIDNSNISLLELLTNNIKQLCYSSNVNYIDFLTPFLNHCKILNSKILLSGFGGDQAVSNHGFSMIKENLKKLKFKNIYKHTNQIKQIYNYSNAKIIISSISNIYLQNFINIIKPYRKIKLLSIYKEQFFSKSIIKELLKKSQRKTFINFNESVKDFIEIQYNYDRITICSELALANNVKYKFPLLDKNLINIYFSIPAEYKTNTKISRYLFRETLKGILPEEIRLRNDKSGSTIPSVQTLFLKDYEKIENFIKICQKTLKNDFFNYDEILKWHQTLKNRSSNRGEIKMSHYVTVLKQLIFLYLYENDEL